MTAAAAGAGAGAGRAGGPFSPMVAMALVLVGVFTFAALVVLSAFAPELRGGNDGGAHALSRSAMGYAGVVQLLKDSGVPVLVSRGGIPTRKAPLAREDAEAGTGQARDEGLLVLTPDVAGDPNQLRTFDFGGPVLIVLPKWVGYPDLRARGWVQRAGTYDAGDLAGRFLTQFGQGAAVRRYGETRRPVLHGAAEDFAGRTLPLGPVDNLQTVDGEGWQPVLTDDQGRGVLLRHEGEEIYLLSDPDLLNTHGIKDLTSAQAAVALLSTLRRGDAPIVFDVSLQGLGRERSLLRLIFTPPYLGMTLILAFAAALMGLHAVARFGPPRRAGRALAFGKQALADNTAALVRMAGREHHMAAPYAALTRAAVARSLSAPRDMDDAQMDAFLDRLGRKAGTTNAWAELMERARRATNVSDLILAARDLYRWRREMTREP